jgi:hypothetical protein
MGVCLPKVHNTRARVGDHNDQVREMQCGQVLQRDGCGRLGQVILKHLSHQGLQQNIQIHVGAHGPALQHLGQGRGRGAGSHRGNWQALQKHLHARGSDSSTHQQSNDGARRCARDPFQRRVPRPEHRIIAASQFLQGTNVHHAQHGPATKCCVLAVLQQTPAHSPCSHMRQSHGCLSFVLLFC